MNERLQNFWKVDSNLDQIKTRLFKVLGIE